jgi:FixJ family two-component response regulator
MVSHQNHSEPPIVVHLVDDDLPFLRALARLLRASGLTVATYESAEALLSELRAESVGCVVTDLMMPGMDGMVLQQALREMGNSMPVLFLTGHGDIPASVRAMRGGAEDFLTKTASKEELLEAVRRALAHGLEIANKDARTAALRGCMATLSPRENQVLREVVAGKLNKQIAADLGIHERTVKLHRTNLCQKLGVHSAAELTHLAHRAGILD